MIDVPTADIMMIVDGSLYIVYTYIFIIDTRGIYGSTHCVCVDLNASIRIIIIIESPPSVIDCGNPRRIHGTTGRSLATTNTTTFDTGSSSFHDQRHPNVHHHHIFIIIS